MKFTATVTTRRTISITNDMLEAVRPYGGCKDRSGLSADFILAQPGYNLMAIFNDRYPHELHVPFEEGSVLVLKFDPFVGMWFSVEKVLHGRVAKRTEPEKIKEWVTA